MTYTSDKWTDDELESLERRIAKVFREASEDLNRDVKEYFAKFKLRDKEMQQLVDAGEMSKADYQKWRITQIGRGQRFEALRDKVAERYSEANMVANAYVNDVTPAIYSLNRNYEAYTIEKAVGSCDFTMWDESTVRRLLVEEPDLMPYYPPSRALDRGIDLAYGKSQITKHVTSGIIRGLPVGRIANELMANMESMNRESAVRAARTAVTAAQNAGRMDSYVAAEKMGIQIKRKWVCTKDSRTRPGHGLADGQIVVGTKAPFIVDGQKLMFPGDTSMGATGRNIYNCRCTTRTVEKDGIEAEPRQTRVRNPEWEQAKAEEDRLTAQVEKLKEREKAETDPDKKKQIRQERIKAQNELKEATMKRQDTAKNVVVPEMNYSEWKTWKKSLANSGNGGTMTVKESATKANPWQNGLPPRGQVKEKIAEEDLYKWVANDLGISESQATEYVDAVMAFTDAGSDIYSEIRRYQRKEPQQFLEEAEAKKLSDDIETYIKKAPRWNGGETFRGSTVSDAELATYKPGQPFTAGGTSSWSGTQRIAKSFAERNATPERPNPVIYHCDTQGKGTGIRHISVYENEDEVLCSKESKWEIVRTEIDADFITHVYVKEV